MLALTGCAHYGRLTPVPSDHQKLVYEDGSPVIYSKKQNLVAFAAPSTIEGESRTRAYVQVSNNSIEDINFSSSSVRVFGPDSNLALRRWYVYTYEDLVAEEQKRQAMQAIAIALQSAGNSMAAANSGYSYTNGMYSGGYTGNVYSGYGSAGYNGMYSGSYSSYTYDPGKVQIANQLNNIQTQNAFAELERNSKQALHELSKSYLKRNTVFPGTICGGLISFSTPYIPETPSEIVFVVEAGNEQHEFHYNMQRK